MSPSPFVLQHAASAPAGRALDVACGRGRHALALARAGRAVDALDRDVTACRELAAAARREGLPIAVVCADVERMPLRGGRWALVVCTLYLERTLFGTLAAALRPGGLLLVETFTREQLRTGHPRNPAFTLAPGELRDLVAGLEVIAYREGPVVRDGQVVHLASVAARAPTP